PRPPLRPRPAPAALVHPRPHVPGPRPRRCLPADQPRHRPGGPHRRRAARPDRGLCDARDGGPDAVRHQRGVRLPDRHRDRWPDVLQLHDRQPPPFRHLKAMGLSNAAVARMVLLQAFTVAVTGWALGLGAASAIGWKMRGTELRFLLPWQLFLGSLGAILFISAGSALLSLRRVMRLEPAIVFRG